MCNILRLFDGCAKFTFCRSETGSQWRLKRLHSELRICLGENQNKRKELFLKIASSGTLSCNASSYQEF